MIHRFLLLIVLLLPTLGRAEDGCVNPLARSFHKMFLGFSPLQCSIDFPTSEAQFCACIKKQVGENALVEVMWNTTEDVEVEQERQRKLYEARFYNIYNDNIFGAAYQKEILFSKDNADKEQKLSTCDNYKMSEAFRSSAKAFYEAEAPKLQDAIQAKERMFWDMGCQKGMTDGKCSVIEKQIDKLKLRLAQPISKKIGKLCEDAGWKVGNATSELSFTADVMKIDPLKKVDEMIKYYEGQTGDFAKDALEDLAAVKKNLVAIKMGQGKLVPSGSKLVYEANVVSTGVMNFAQGEIKSTCSRSSMEESMQAYLAPYIGQYQYDRISQAKKDKTAVKDLVPDDCMADDPLCSQLGKFNNELNKKYGDTFKEDSNTSCYSRAEYLTFKSMPGPNLVQAFKNASGDELKKLLEPPRFAQTALDQERVQFLKANPIIAKLSTVDALKEKLSQGLKNLAQNFTGSDAKKLDAYLKFMKKDVKDALASPEGMLADRKSCDDLAQVWTAIEVADHFPNVERKQDSDPTEVMYERVTACKITEKGDDAISNIKATLADNKLFLVNGETTLADAFSPEGYKDFTDKNCAGYDNHVKKNCEGKSSATCRESFPARAGFNKVVKENNLTTVITASNVKNAARVVNSKYDDKEFEGWYNKNVRKRTNRSPIAFRGEENKFADANARADEILNDAQVPSSFYNSAPRNQVTSSSTETPTTPPAWLKELPPMQDAPVTVNDVQTAENVNDLLPQDPNQTYEERQHEREELIEELKQVQEDAKELGDEQEKLVNEKIKKFQQQLAQQKVNDQKQMKQDKAKPQSIPPQSYVATGAGGGAMGQGVLNMGSGSGAVSRTQVSKTRAQEGYNKVVLSMYDGRKEVSMPSGLTVQDIPANPEALSLALSVEELHPSKDEFDAFVKEEDGQKQLAVFLYQKLPRPYKDQVVTLIHPETKEVLRVHVFKEGKGFTARPFQRKFKRSSMEGFLKQAL